MPTEIPVTSVVPIREMIGDDDEETALLKGMCAEAKRYLESFEWCIAAEPICWGGGIGKIFSILLFEITPSRDQIDRWLWVVVGDIPRLYLVLDDCKSPSQVLDTYVELMEQWIDLARQGRTSDELPPTGVEPTPEWAAELEQRLKFIQTQNQAIAERMNSPQRDLGLAVQRRSGTVGDNTVMLPATLRTPVLAALPVT